MKTPIIAINLKTYAEATGDKAIEIAKICKKIDKEHIIIACQAADIYRVSKKAKIDVYAQHIDSLKQGAGTGYLTAEAAKEAGAKGTILNHSEHRISKDEIIKSIERAKENNLTVILCAKDDNEAEEFARTKADFIAVEPPDLIGGDVSVTTRPDLVTDSVAKVKRANSEMKILVGAGVKTKEDVRKAIELGADGVLLASGVTKAADKKKVIKELVEGLK
jgi:triosephosphate isomerase